MKDNDNEMPVANGGKMRKGLKTIFDVKLNLHYAFRAFLALAELVHATISPTHKSRRPAKLER